MNAYMETLCVLFYTELDPFVSLLLSVSKPGPNLFPDLPAPELLSSGRVRGGLYWVACWNSFHTTHSELQTKLWLLICL